MLGQQFEQSAVGAQRRGHSSCLGRAGQGRGSFIEKWHVTNPRRKSFPGRDGARGISGQVTARAKAKRNANLGMCWAS